MTFSYSSSLKLLKSKKLKSLNVCTIMMYRRSEIKLLFLPFAISILGIYV